LLCHFEREASVKIVIGSSVYFKPPALNGKVTYKNPNFEKRSLQSLLADKSIFF
jgi:hypothetical protein